LFFLLTGISITLSVQTQHPWTIHTQDPWDHAPVYHTGSAGIPSKEKTHLNLAALVMHGDEAYLKEERKWETLHNKGNGISHNDNSIHQIHSKPHRGKT